ncbi:hypothetical protein ACQEVX_35730 [Streptomyces syringium]|uniref:hypothetical protein n=1 Tax=Streptomyces syringium TaxID=76729 RepID=UPI003D935604
MAADAITLVGFLDEETVPGDLHGSTARFRLTVSPTDEHTDELILPCTIADPQMAHTVLHELVPGDQLHVTGYLHLPRTPEDPMRLVVTELTLMQPAPRLSDQATAIIERYGPYVCWFDADTPDVEVFTEAGDWVGTAPEPNGIGQLLAAFEHRQAAGGE